MPTWIRIALIIVLVLVLWWLAVTLARGVAQKTPPAGTGSVIAVEARLVA
jgi:hypothetical protein